MADHHSIVFILFFLSLTLSPSSEDEQGNNSKPICPASFSCSNLAGYLRFPFYTNSGNYSSCGLYEVNCNQQVPKIQLIQNYPSYDLLKIMPGAISDSLLVRDNYFANQISSNSCDSLTMYRFPSNSSSISYSISPTLALLRCVKSPGLAQQVDRYFLDEGEYYRFESCYDYNYYYTYYSSDYILAHTDIPPPCSVIFLPGNPPSSLPNSANFNNLFTLLISELTLLVQVSDECQQCYRKGGKCSNKNQEFLCEYSTRNRNKENGRHIVIKSALATIAVGSAIISIALILCFRLKIFSRYNTKSNVNVEAFIKNQEALAPKRYPYSKIRKMTNSFKVKIGEGGYGSVYRGTLQNGNLVAVKVLNELKGNGEELVNELASISKTCHVNIVSLLGFCFEGHHKALIYEYMPNGSLEKFIYNRTSPTGIQLEQKKLYEIAVGIGRGLEYLHRGCNTRILHFDIKPHNILLDQDLCPKISDFGLAKLCSEKRSVVSMSGMRGTPGYIAPEVFSRNFGAVSHKSDVYSYGMMVLEMVGGQSNVVVEDDGTSNMYFHDLIYKQFVLSNENLAMSGVVLEEDKELVMKMVFVSLWCIQSDPSSRPSMSKVLDMLEGNLESIEIPPKPFLFSTQRLPDSLS